MPTRPDPGHDPLGRLDERLARLEASRRQTPTGAGSTAGLAEGYRLVGRLLGGVFGGVGLGWLVDHFAHTRPFGLVGGLLIGSTVSIVAAIRTASGGAAPVAGPASPDDDDED